MRQVIPLNILCLSLLLAACSEEPQAPELAPLDTAQSRGALLASGEAVYHGNLVWVPGTELVAFTTQPTAAHCAIKTVNAANGSTGVVDDDCVSLGDVVEWRYTRSLATAPDRSALYYTAGLNEHSGGPGSEFVLRVGHLDDGIVSTLRSVRWDAVLAASPDGRHLAYVTAGGSQEGNRSLVVRDLASGDETRYAEFDEEVLFAGPILFSPEGSELLYEVYERVLGPRILHRLSLHDGADQLESLPETVDALLFHWDASGIEVLVEIFSPPEIHVLYLTTGESVQVASIERGQGGPYEQFNWAYHAWSSDGARVAYWIARCFEYESLFGDCLHARHALFVADTRSGTRVRVAYTSAGSGPIVFSPDGTRLVYHVPDGDFYVVEVP